MRFLPLDELLREREKLARQLKSAERSDALLVSEGILSADDQAFLADGQRQLLADLDREIAERTGLVEPAENPAESD